MGISQKSFLYKHRNQWWNVILGISVILILLPFILLCLYMAPYISFHYFINSISLLVQYGSNTIIIVVLTLIFSSMWAIGAAWFVSHYTFSGESFIKIAILLPLAVPPYAMAFIYNELFSYGGFVFTFLTGLGVSPRSPLLYIQNIWGASFILSLSYYPYLYMALESAFRKANAHVGEIAQSLGYNSLQNFWHLSLPLARPALIGGLTLIMMETISNYGVVSYFGISTFTTGIMHSWISLGDKAETVLLTLTLLFFIILCILFERLGRSRSRFSHSDYKAFVRKKGMPLYCILLIIVPIVLGFVIPCVQLLQWVVYARDMRVVDDFLTYTGFTIGLALCASIIIMLWAWICNVSYINSSKSMKRISVGLSIGYAMPGSILGLSFLVSAMYFDDAIEYLFGLMDIEPFYVSGSLLLLLCAYSVRYVAVAYNPLSGVFAKIGVSLQEVARSLGYSPFVTSYYIHFRLLKDVLPGIMMLVFIELIKELPMSLMLRSFNVHTLAIRAYQAASDERLYDAALPSLCIIVIGIIVIGLWECVFSKRIRMLYD